MTKRKWTDSEDQILRESVKSNIKPKQLALSLNRTEAAIMSRKTFLGIGRAQPVQKDGSINPEYSSLKLVETLDKKGLWEIEENVPLPTRTNATQEETNTILSKLREILKTIKPSQSFVIPRAALRHLVSLSKMDFPEYRIRTSATTKEKRFYRIYRLA